MNIQKTQLKNSGISFEEFILSKLKDRFRNQVLFERPIRIKDINFFLSHAKPLTKEETRDVLILLAESGEIEFVAKNKVIIKKEDGKHECL